jgi:alkylation response protein AidB-like acyl-CoA dehydrogenase
MMDTKAAPAPVAEPGAALILRTRLTELAIDVDTVEMLELLALQDQQDSEDSGITPSIIKLRGSLVEQDLNQLALDISGEAALRWHPHRPLHELNEAQAALEMLAVMPRALNSRVRTVFGGSSEVQLSIIARSLMT